LGVGRTQLACRGEQVIAAVPEGFPGRPVAGLGASDSGPGVAEPVGELLLGQAGLAAQRGEQVSQRPLKRRKLVRPILVGPGLTPRLTSCLSTRWPDRRLPTAEQALTQSPSRPAAP
jgi:hypothetical protein